MRFAVALSVCAIVVGMAAAAAAPARRAVHAGFTGWAGFTPGGRYVQIGPDRSSGRYFDLHGKRVLQAIGRDDGAVFSPDDRHVAISRRDGVHVLDIASGATADLADYAEPSWSRDGAFLVLTGVSTALAVASGDFTQPSALPYTPSADCVNVDAPTIANGGKRFTYVEAVGTPEACAGLYADKNTPGSLYVSDVAAADARELDEPLCGGERIEWSADGRWIASENGVDCSSQGAVDARLNVLDPIGTTRPRFLTKARNPFGPPVWAWAPVGDWIAYVATRGTVVERAGGGSSVFLRAAFDVAWAPDAQRLVVVQRGHVRIVSRRGRLIRTIGIGGTVDWSRATGWISYVRRGCGPASGVHLVRPDGSHDHVFPGTACTVA